MLYGGDKVKSRNKGKANFFLRVDDVFGFFNLVADWRKRQRTVQLADMLSKLIGWIAGGTDENEKEKTTGSSASSGPPPVPEKTVSLKDHLQSVIPLLCILN